MGFVEREYKGLRNKSLRVLLRFKNYLDEQNMEVNKVKDLFGDKIYQKIVKVKEKQLEVIIEILILLIG